MWYGWYLERQYWKNDLYMNINLWMIEYSDDDNNSYKNDYDDDEYDPILYLIIFVE